MKKNLVVAFYLAAFINLGFGCDNLFAQEKNEKVKVINKNEVKELPKWVPAPGEVATLTTANGGITNTLKSTAPAYYAAYYSCKVVTDYSGGVLNKDYGPYGATIFFGGGHFSTNENSVYVLENTQKACTWSRKTNPTPIFGSGTDDETKGKNSLTASPVIGDQVNVTYSEYKIDGQPVSPHSYATPVIIPASSGGAAYGTLMTVVSTAGTFDGYHGSESAHKVDFKSLTDVTTWSRVTDNHGAMSSFANQSSVILGPPAWSLFVPTQNRVYYDCHAASRPFGPKWFDLKTNTYVQGTGKARSNNSDETDCGAMIDVLSRGMLLFLDPYQGKLRIEYMDVTANQPSWVCNSVKLSVDLKLSPGWNAACWCEDNQRIIVGGVAGDTTAVYEIEIPKDLNSVWTVTRAPFGEGQTITWPINWGYKTWSYNPLTKTIPVVSIDFEGVSDTVKQYRPRELKNEDPKKAK